MGDEQGCLVLHHMGKFVVQIRFGQGIQLRGGFIQQQNRLVAHKSPGDGNPLPLAAGQVYALLKIPAQQSVITFFITLRKTVSFSLSRRFPDFFLLIQAVDIAHADVLPDGDAVPGKVLEDGAEQLRPQAQRVFRQVAPAHQNLSSVRGEQA